MCIYVSLYQYAVLCQFALVSDYIWCKSVTLVKLNIGQQAPHCHNLFVFFFSFASTGHRMWHESYVWNGLVFLQSLIGVEKTLESSSSPCQLSQTLYNLWILHLLRWPILTSWGGGPTSCSTCRMWWSKLCGGTSLPGHFTSQLMQSLWD